VCTKTWILFVGIQWRTRIEVYTPAPKRKYGYFTLPILYNNALIGRIDPKAHRKVGIFEVKALHLEPGVGPAPREETLRALRSAQARDIEGTSDLF
jgi:uncharacterized protein YcaQ